MYRGKRKRDSSAPSVNGLRLREPRLHRAPVSGLDLLCSSIYSITSYFHQDMKLNESSKQEVSYSE